MRRWAAPAALTLLLLAIVASSLAIYRTASRAYPEVRFPASIPVGSKPVVQGPPIPVAFHARTGAPPARGGAAAPPALRPDAPQATPPCTQGPDTGSACGIA